MLIAFTILLQAGFVVRVLLRAHRDPASRIAWIVVILALPVVGIVAYLLLGETNIGRKRVDRMKRGIASLPDISSAPGFDAPTVRPEIPERHSLFNARRRSSLAESVDCCVSLGCVTFQGYSHRSACFCKRISAGCRQACYSAARRREQQYSPRAHKPLGIWH